MNYREELYKNIIVGLKKEMGRTPYAREAIESGVNIVYIKRKFGSYYNFCQSIGVKMSPSCLNLKEAHIKTNKKYCLFDKETNELVMCDVASKIAEFVKVKESALRYMYINKSIIKSRYYAFNKFNFMIFELCDYSFENYKKTMLFRYNKNYFRKDRKRKYNEMYRIKTKIDNNSLILSDYVDVEKFKDIEMSDYED